MSLQDLRGAMEAATRDALVAGGMDGARIFWPNVGELPPLGPAEGPWARISVDFPRIVTPTVGCEGMNSAIGTCLATVYWPKGEGPAGGSEMLTWVIQAWCQLNQHLRADNPQMVRTFQIDGPTMADLGRRPWAMFSASCGFTGTQTPRP